MYGTIAIGVFSLFLQFAQLDVPYYDQTVYYQTACESVATVASLNYLGYDISIDDFLDNYLARIDYWEDELDNPDYNIFDRYFVGNPRTYDGWLCYPPVIVSGVEQYFSDIGETKRSPYNLTGVGFNFLLDEVALGHPVVIWIMSGFETTELKEFRGNTYCADNHAVVLSGYDRRRGVVFIVDSIDGVLELDYCRVKSCYDFAGKRSVVIK